MGVAVLAVTVLADQGWALCEYLRSRGQVCHLSRDRNEALSRLGERRYDLIVADFTDDPGLMTALAGEIRREGQVNRLTRMACLDLYPALEEDGDRVLLERLCHLCFDASLGRARIMALYRCLDERRFGDFFEIVAEGRSRTALSTIVDDHGGQW